MSLDPAHLAALAAILRTGSFEAAAQALRVTPSAISQRLKALEDRVGTALVNRAQPCTGTEAGVRLARHADDIALLEAQALRGLNATLPQQPHVRIAVNADSLSTWLMPALAQVPDMCFDLHLDDQSHCVEWLKRGDVSAAITSAAKPAPGCDIRFLGHLRYVAVCAPAFQRRWFAQGADAQSLGQAPMIVFTPKDTLQIRWATLMAGQRPTPPAHYIPAGDGFLQAVQAGLGWGMVPEIMACEGFASRTLTLLAPDAPLDEPHYWQVSRRMAPALSTLSSAVVRAARAALVQGS